MKRKGFFITFEGGEGAGKSTQIQHACTYLKKLGKKAVLLREPGSTSIGEKIRQVLLDSQNQKMCVETELFLYLAARAQLVREMILPELAKGSVVVCDRFEDSTLAYQGHGGGISLDLLKKVSVLARGTLTPNLTFFLDLNPKEGLKRAGRRDRMEQKSIQFHEKLHQGYLLLARQNLKRIIVLDATESISEIQKKIEKELSHALA